MMGAECFVSAAVLRVPRTLWASQGGMAACLTSAVCVYAVGVCGWQREGPGRARTWLLVAPTHEPFVSVVSLAAHAEGMPHMGRTVMSLCAHCSTPSSTHIMCIL